MKNKPRRCVITVRTWWNLFVIGSSLCASSTAPADVLFQVSERMDEVKVEIVVVHTISAKDAESLDAGFTAAKQFANARRKELGRPHFVLGSPGGDVIAGMTIGRWARARGASAEVLSECSSACVLILAGAVTRQVQRDGKIGIHRIHFRQLQPSATYGQVREKLSEVDKFLSEYLRDMDIPLSLMEEMKSVAPDQIRFLSRAELQRFRLVGTDPAYQELVDAREAARWGMSREEHYRFKSKCSKEEKESKYISYECATGPSAKKK